VLSSDIGLDIYSKATIKGENDIVQLKQQWLDQLQRRTITVSLPPHCDHHLIGGDLLVVQDPPG